MRENIVIWGAAGHSTMVTEILRLRNESTIVGYIDDINPENIGREIGDTRVLGGAEQLDYLSSLNVDRIILAFGDCAPRLEKANQVREKGFILAQAIHPSAIISASASIGDGSVVAAGAILNPYSTIGDVVIVNTGATIDHECVIADGVHIGPGVHLGGRVHIGRGTWLGIGAIVVDNVRIGANSVIGAGAVVIGDIPKNVLAYGVPAKVVRER